jgi:hypothetical protein
MSYRPNVKVLSLHVSMGFQTTNIKRALDWVKVTVSAVSENEWVSEREMRIQYFRHKKAPRRACSDDSEWHFASQAKPSTEALSSWRHSGINPHKVVLATFEDT